MKTKIGILSMGCPRNLVDSESILGRLNLKGYQIVDMHRADVAVVNTCAFIDEAKRESIDTIMDLVELKRQKKLRKIIVYGCLPQRYKDNLRKNLPEIDAFVGRVSLNHNSQNYSLSPKHYAYLKICEGCINNCSFCVIPKIKGKFASLDIETVLKKLRQFNKDRVSEVNIIGQDISGYGLDLYGELELPRLLKKIIKEARDIGWIRLLYLYPSRISDELLWLIRDEPKICKYIDLPVQHINERILKLMHRDTSKGDCLRLIDKIRKTIPGVALRTSIIAGFPTETDREFKELLRFLEDARFERLGAFIYSREEGTPAYNFKNQIPRRIGLERFNAIMSLQQKISAGINKKFLGSILDVLIDEKQGGSTYLGRTQYDAPEVDGMVYVNSKRKLKPGDFVKVKIHDTLEYDLTGEVIL
ncbi:MAG: MiaB/RimO family radical SAM methylthiotransferase [Candidatus Omnitrophica bacterium]|nr:MiaB/RimO family radical SAM methylthiotransferase [Candidatus Omnitrophota bacterium]MDD5237808.1 MiaB/RimO family radical SAM methylthiotransferase [Candidatus Omnitrophota bacterium]